ncbi:hypothetical protein E4T43_05041 [Aureobasidium subglaciale]|nr:hypothetical protein E4T43_05041 [Aureobasidium subglaciale]
MESRASSAMNDAGSRSPTGPPRISTIKAERTTDGTPHEIMSASQTPAPNTADQPTGSGSRQSSSRPADLSSAQDFSDVAMGDAMPYGTRSRNRAGNPRPNYAEDQDMDFEVPPPPAKPASAKNATANQQDAIETKTTVVEPSFARVNGADHDERSPSASGKETIPGTSTFSTVPPKKRKAAGVANTAIVASGSGNTTTNAVAQPTTKRPASSMPLANMSPESNMMTFEKSKGVLRKGGLVADDGQILYVNDHVYLVCEPPGDPYYLCRIMEFLHTKSDDPKSSVDSIRVNWFYRPRDVQRLSSDSRLVYGTMHSDVCPLTSLRGKCKILHRSEIDNLDEYRKESNCFWFSQIFDRFIRRFYEVIPTSQIINVPDKVKRALDERWKFIAVEVNRVKELTAAVKLCKRCTQYCASNDSVDCAICGTCYHMNCVRPPLPKKPTRGFAWACGPCGRAAEKKLEARNTPLGGVDEEEEIVEEEEEDPALAASTRAPSPSGPDVATDQHPGTQAEIAMAKMWPFRYLGIHCRVEDALQYDDRAIYPRASSRLGPRHQANVNVWHGRPVDLRKPADIKKRFVKGGGQKKDTKLTKETLAAIEADRKEREKRPKWVQDEPPGYVHRGEDFDNDDPNNTARLIFKMPNDDDEHAPASSELFIDKHMDRVKAAAKSLKVTPCSANYLDKALELLIQSEYNSDKAIEQLSKVDRIKDLKEPILTADELKKFEEGVMKYGSEHRSVRLHMKTHRPTSTIIRFYYLWKKTPRGRQIWDSYGGRKGRKRQNMDAASKLQAEVAHDLDDSAFDTDKANDQKRGFQCKHCSTRHSRQWRRAPGISPGQTVPSGEGKTAKDKSNRLLLALCGRCAGLWRRYAIVWEDIDEATKKAVQAGGRAWKRKLDEEVVREILASNEAAPADANVIVQSVEGAEPPKKKAKLGLDGAEKKKAPKLPTPPPPPIVPEEPRWRDLECFVCNVLDSAGERPICTNDRTPAVSTEYLCTLCPIEETAHEMLEPPRVTHKKKSDREREKERLEKELMDSVQLDYSKKQANLNRPINPREPLKRTDGNNWVHVQCAIWTPEIRFSDASLLERAEGLSAIPMERYEAVCKVCKKNNHGACVSCLQCRANFHVGCAVQAGYTLGFDVTPVKGSRKDQVITAKLGEETGALTAAIWCKEHAVKTAVHPISEAIDDKTQNALQVFVENYKQADPTLTGTARKANLLSQSTKLASQATLASGNANRRISTASGLARSARNSPAGAPRNDEADGTSSTEEELAKTCLKCHTDTSPRWWTAEETLKKLQDHTPCEYWARQSAYRTGQGCYTSGRIGGCKDEWSKRKESETSPSRTTRSGVGMESRGRAERGESRAEPMLSVTLDGIVGDRDIGIAVIRMGKAYPEEARSQVRQLLQQGVAEDEIEKQTGVSDRTIRRWKVKRLRYGRIGKPPESRTGRHRVMNKDVEQALFDRVAQKPDMSVDDMLWWLYDTYKLVVGTRTIRRAFERRNTSHKKFRTHARKHFSIDMGADMDLDSDVDVDVHVDTQSHDHHAPMQNLVHEPVSMPAPQAHMTVSQPDATYQSPYAPLMAMADATDGSNQPPPPDISPELARALGGLTESTHMHQDLMPDHMDPLSEDEETLQLQLQQIMLQKKEVELKLKMRRLRQRRESHTPNDDSLFDHLDVDTTSNSHMLPDSTANNDPFAPQSVTTDTNPNTPKPRDSRSKSKVQEARKRTEERQERMLKDLERRSRRREHLTAEWVQSRDVWAKGPEKLLVQLMHKHSTYAYNQNSLETFEAIFAELYHLVDHTEWYAPVHDDLLRERTRRKMSQLRSKMVKSGEIISRGEGYGGWTKPDDHDALAGAADLSGTAPEDTSLDISQHHHQINGLSMDLHAHDSNHGSLMARDAMMQHDHSMLEHLQGNSADLHHGDFDHDQLARHQNELLAQRGIAHEAQLSHQIEETMAAGLASV